MKYYTLINPRANTSLEPHAESQPPLHDNILTEASSLEEVYVHFSAISQYITKTRGPSHNIAVQEGHKPMRWLNGSEQDILMKLIVNQRHYEPQIYGEPAGQEEQDDMDARP